MPIKLAHQQAKTPVDDRDVATRDYVDESVGAADSLFTSGDNVDLSSSDPPTIGQVLTASSPTTAEWQTFAAAEDTKVKVTGADTTSGNLNAKIAAGSKISLAVLNPGDNEQLQISSTGAALDAVQEFTKSQRSHIVTLADAATVSFSAEDSNIYSLTATGAVGATRELENPGDLVAGMTWQVWFIQDGTGSRALTFDTFYDWGDEGAPDFSAQDANNKNIITCVALSSTQIAATTLLGFA